MQIIQTVSLGILYLVVNGIYFMLSVSTRSGRVKHKLRKTRFIFAELIVLISWYLVSEGISFGQLVDELLLTSMYEKILTIIAWGLAIVLVNILGIEATIYYKRNIKNTKLNNNMMVKQEEREKNENNQENKSLRRLEVCGILLITFIGAVGYMYWIGMLNERQRDDFKFVIEEVGAEEDNRYIFNDNDKSYCLYPVVYENDEVYVLSRTSKEENSIKIDYDDIKVVDKDNVWTFYHENVRIKNNYKFY